MADPGLLGAQDLTTGLTVGGDFAALQPLLDWRNRNLESLSAGLTGPSGEAPITSRVQAASLAPQLDLSNPLLMALGPGSIRGFHGTAAPPFSQFSNEMIGSGEGAQSFGWGHYVAGNPSVAEEYPHGKGSGSLLEVNIKPEEEELLDWDKPLSQQSPQVQQALQSLPLHAKYASKIAGGSGGDFYNRFSSVYGGPQAASQALHEAGIPGLKYLDAGSRNLRSPEAVQESLDIAKGNYEFHKSLLRPDDPSEINTFLSNTISQSRDIVDRYEQELEQAKNPTRNYVIFDPSNLEIKARNGIPLEPVDHNPFQGEQP